MASPARGTLSLSLSGSARPSDPRLVVAPGLEVPLRTQTAEPGDAGGNSTTFAASNRKSRDLEAEQDRALIEVGQKGDKVAFKQLVLRHQRRAFAIALGLL